MQGASTSALGDSLTEKDASEDISNNWLTLQIQAFLEASEDVGIDPETVEDLLELLSPASSGAQSPLNLRDTIQGEVEMHEEEVDLSALYTSHEEAQQAWTALERNWMMKHLKEHGMSSFIQKYVITRQIPVPKLLKAFGIILCPEMYTRKPATLHYFLKVAMSREIRLRDRLEQYNTITDAVELIRKSTKILILTGAGISVSCGIPDFRSRDGLYSTLGGYYELDDPQQMFDITYFKENPNVFYSFASKIYPSNFVPSPCHRFIKEVEDRNKLLRNYTQNIDTLETLAGVKRVLQCHGSFATASCILCRRQVDGRAIEKDILAHKVPLCTLCNVPSAPAPKATKKGKKKKANKDRWDSDAEDDDDDHNIPVSQYPPGIMKPDITFFGEKLTDEFDQLLEKDREEVDLLIVIGTSLKVAPVADVISYLPHSVPQILINKTPIRHINPDIMLLGNADDVMLHLAKELGWTLPDPPPTTPSKPAATITRLYPSRENSASSSTATTPQPTLKKRTLESEESSPKRVTNSHIWLFEGAEGGKWLREYEENILSAVAVAPDSDNGREKKRARVDE